MQLYAYPSDLKVNFIAIPPYLNIKQNIYLLEKQQILYFKTGSVET